MPDSVKVFLVGLAMVGLAACSGEPPPEPEQSAQTEQAEDADHVWKDQVETIDRAKAVEQTIKDADEAKRKAIEDADDG